MHESERADRRIYHATTEHAMNKNLMKSEIDKPSGFALVSTILLMILLTIIALGTLSLSAISIRTNSQNSANMEAQANARMALMIAIGELQQQMGPDQRISANAEILDKSGSFEVTQKQSPSNESMCAW